MPGCNVELLRGDFGAFSEELVNLLYSYYNNSIDIVTSEDIVANIQFLAFIAHISSSTVQWDLISAV